MTDVPARLDAGQLEPDEPAEPAQPAEPASGYRRPAARYPGVKYVALLRTPGAARFCVSAMIGRAPMSMFGLGTVLLVAASTGRYALAGLVAGAGSIGYALCAPQLARLADRFGQHRVLRPLIAFFAIACVVFVLCAELRAPLWLLMITGCLAGSSMPSLGSMVRARWSALLSDPAALQSAFALESVVDEMVFVVGPGPGDCPGHRAAAGWRPALHGAGRHRDAVLRCAAADGAACPATGTSAAARDWPA